MKSICMLMPYFGAWPAWIDLYIETCKWNPTITWVFFTDCGMPRNRADNVKYVAMDLAGFRALASRKLDLDVAVTNVRKVCDLRPMFGVVFEEYCAEYDFFGYGDIDLVYGDLRSFLTDEALSRDVVSFAGTFVSGHCALVRNTEEGRSLFRKMERWRECLQTPAHWRYDEDMFHRVIPESRRYFMDGYTSPTVCSPWRGGSYHLPTEWYWRKGQVTNDQDHFEYAYFHFLFWRGFMNPWWGWHRRRPGSIMHFDTNRLPDGWRINADGFFAVNEWPPLQSGMSRFLRSVQMCVAVCVAKVIKIYWSVRFDRWLWNIPHDRSKNA